MAKTRTGPPSSNGNGTSNNDLVAAAFILEEKSSSSLLYNAQTVDYMVNSVGEGDTNAAWFYWAKLPELRYVSRYIANALSIATLYVGMPDKNLGGAPKRLDEDHPASELLKDFAGGYAGQSELLDRLALHLTVAGDSILIGPKHGSGTLEAPFDQWRVYSTEEVYSRQGKIYVKFPTNSREVQIPEGSMAIRIWRPHPRVWWSADSPVKGSFEVLKELHMLNQHILASGASRLVGAGLLGIPEELDLPGSDIEVEGTEVDQFVALLIEIMGMAKKNPESPAARIPIMLRGPAEYIDKIKHFDFSTEFSDMVPELRLGSIRRLALGMDIPPEILVGSAESNSWSAFQTDSSTLRVHLVPLLQLITSSLTVGWLRPMLESLPLSEAQKAEIPDIVIHYDVSNLKIHQDTSGDVQALYDRHEVDADILRIALGYGADAAPDDKELARQILLALIKTGDSLLVPYAIEGLRDNFGIDMLPKPPEVGGAPVAPRVTERVVDSIGRPGNTKIEGIKTTPVSGPLPGKRSQAKQTSPPPIPKVDGDQGNNQVT